MDTTTTPARKSIQEIVQIAKDRALIEIVTNGKTNIEQAFAALKIEADQLKGFDKSYVPPWEVSRDPIAQETTPPPIRIRKFVFRNAMDGIIYAAYELTKLNPKWPKFDSGELQTFIYKTLDVHYSQPWMSKSLETLFYDSEYRDLIGRRVIVTRTRGNSGHYRVKIP